jgi:hypothetical protein
MTAARHGGHFRGERSEIWWWPAALFAAVGAASLLLLVAVAVGTGGPDSTDPLGGDAPVASSTAPDLGTARELGSVIPLGDVDERSDSPGPVGTGGSGSIGEDPFSRR